MSAAAVAAFWRWYNRARWANDAESAFLAGWRAALRHEAKRAAAEARGAEAVEQDQVLGAGGRVVGETARQVVGTTATGGKVIR